MKFFAKFTSLHIKFPHTYLFTYFNQLDSICCISLNSLDPHIVIHAFLNKSSLSEIATFLTNMHGVQFDQFRQMKEHVGLIVTQ